MRELEQALLERVCGMCAGLPRARRRGEAIALEGEAPRREAPSGTDATRRAANGGRTTPVPDASVRPPMRRSGRARPRRARAPRRGRRSPSHFVNNVLAAAASYIDDDPDYARDVLAELGQFLSYRLRADAGSVSARPGARPRRRATCACSRRASPTGSPCSCPTRAELPAAACARARSRSRSAGASAAGCASAAARAVVALRVAAGRRRARGRRSTGAGRPRAGERVASP